MNRNKKQIVKCLFCGIKGAVIYKGATGLDTLICSACDHVAPIERQRDLCADNENVTETHVLAQVSE